MTPSYAYRLCHLLCMQKLKIEYFFSFMNPVGEYLLSGCCVALFSILLAVEYFKLNNLKLKDAITLIR